MTKPDRPEPPHAGPEKGTLEGFLDWQRATVLWKVEGLSDADLRRPMTASGMTMLGVVKHLAYVERWWFQTVFLDRDVSYPWTDEDPDADFRIEPEESTADVLALYTQETAEARAIVEAAPLDDESTHPRRTGYSLRWILAHMLEETARHNGHLDLMREVIDGVTGE
jgi:uncharacterized damage-inducible protein DinB